MAALDPPRARRRRLVGRARSWAVIATAVFVAALAMLFNVGGTELVLDRDLDTNEELRDAGLLNVVSGVLGGIPATTRSA